MKIDIPYVEKIIGHTFKDKELLTRAFTHSSMKKATSDCKNYERMEFLGDAILDFVVAEYLYVNYDNFDEGNMTTIRAKLVSKTPLSEVIFNLGNENAKANSNSEGIARFMSIGNGSYKFNLSDKMRCDLYESIVAAIYLDSGMEQSKQFILFTLRDILLASGEVEGKDDRSKLQEYCAKNGISCIFREVGAFGADNERIFEFIVEIDGERLGGGKAYTKKLAQQFAAKEAISKLKIN